MTIVEKLRARADRRDLSSIAYAADCALDREAAAEIERLRKKSEVDDVEVEELNEAIAFRDAEIERLREALRAILTISDCHENARQIARAALGEIK